MRRTKAEGGWGVIFTEQTEIHPTSEVTPFIEHHLWDDRDIPALARTLDKSDLKVFRRWSRNAGRRHAEDLDQPAPGDPLCLRREIALLAPRQTWPCTEAQISSGGPGGRRPPGLCKTHTRPQAARAEPQCQISANAPPPRNPEHDDV